MNREQRACLKREGESCELPSFSTYRYYVMLCPQSIVGEISVSQECRVFMKDYINIICEILNNSLSLTKEIISVTVLTQILTTFSLSFLFSFIFD